jgi:hypothetical protein
MRETSDRELLVLPPQSIQSQAPPIAPCSSIQRSMLSAFWVAPFAEPGSGHLRFGHRAGNEKFRHAAVQRVQAAAEPAAVFYLVGGFQAQPSRACLGNL